MGDRHRPHPDDNRYRRGSRLHPRRVEKRVANPDAVRILYGGSVNAKNAAEILGVANVDGALVGGASLDGASFWTIAQAAG